jgi:hypothetical protein
MSTVFVALTALDPGADKVLDELAASFPVSAFRGSPGVWLVEVDQDGDDATVDQAEERVGQALASISQAWESVIKVGATGEGIQSP